MNENTMTLSVAPMFPSEVRANGVCVMLYADGTWSGDRAAFVAAVAEMRQTGEPVSMPLLWLVVASLKAENKRDQ
jgi:hypothetical protein